MFDELDSLRGTRGLFAVLAHYAQAGAADRDTWQDPLMTLDSFEPSHLVTLHGELLAFGWIEQNTGHTPVLKAGVAAGCYRITATGMRVFRQAHAGQTLDAREAA